MANNVPITSGSGTNIATDQVPGTLEHVQLFKLAYSASGVRSLVPVDANGVLVQSTDATKFLADVNIKSPLGQALAAASVPVILPSATITTLTPPAAITGFALAATQTDKSQLTQITDGTRVGTVKAASTLPVATDTALVVSLRESLSTAVTNASLDGTLLATLDTDIKQISTDVKANIVLATGANVVGVSLAKSSSRTDTYTAAGNGTAVTATANPFKAYAVQVVGTGAAASLWDVRLEGSLEGTNYDQILQHTNATGDGKIVFSGSLLAPALYVRSRVAGLTLGPATNVSVTIVGVQ